MGDHNDGQPVVAVDLLKKFEDTAAGFLVEIAGRLVG